MSPSYTDKWEHKWRENEKTKIKNKKPSLESIIENKLNKN